MKIIIFIFTSKFLMQKLQKYFHLMSSLVLSISSVIQGQSQLPCYKCTTDYKPICGRSVKSGELKTFQNNCIMKSEDCGKYEPRKFIKFFSQVLIYC